MHSTSSRARLGAGRGSQGEELGRGSQIQGYSRVPRSSPSRSIPVLAHVPWRNQPGVGQRGAAPQQCCCKTALILCVQMRKPLSLFSVCSNFSFSDFLVSGESRAAACEVPSSDPAQRQPLASKALGTLLPLTSPSRCLVTSFSGAGMAGPSRLAAPQRWDPAPAPSGSSVPWSPALSAAAAS